MKEIIFQALECALIFGCIVGISWFALNVVWYVFMAFTL